MVLLHREQWGRREMDGYEKECFYYLKTNMKEKQMRTINTRMGCSSVIEYLHSIHKAPSLIFSTAKTNKQTNMKIKKNVATIVDF
jgi:hypothetical protein